VIAYPEFIAAMAGRDPAAVAQRAGIPVAVIEALLAGEGWVVAREHRAPLARALRRQPDALFRAVSVLPDGQEIDLSSFGRRSITDPAVLRRLERGRVA
jgi:L-2-hydroxyglutarate oxidase LhgO